MALKNNWCNDVSDLKLHGHITCLATWKWNLFLIECSTVFLLNCGCGSCGSTLWSLEDLSPQHKSCDCADQFNAKTSTIHGCKRQLNLKSFFLNFLSSSVSFSFVFSIYLYYFLPFFFCIISDVPLLPICISSTSKHMFCCIFLYFT